jgi:hypothetical protein
MRIEVDYLKELLQAFLNAPGTTTDIRELRQLDPKLDCERDPRFEFHIRLLADGGYVQRDDGKWDMGYERSADGLVFWNVLPLRLTAAGHEFAAALCNSHVYEEMEQQVKKNVLPSTLSVIRDVAVALLKGEVAKHTGLHL